MIRGGVGKIMENGSREMRGGGVYEVRGNGAQKEEKVRHQKLMKKLNGNEKKWRDYWIEFHQSLPFIYLGIMKKLSKIFLKNLYLGNKLP